MLLNSIIVSSQLLLCGASTSEHRAVVIRRRTEQPTAHPLEIGSSLPAR
jgi:hypothetical protein